MVLEVSRKVWMGGLAFAAACAVLGLVLWRPEPLFLVPFGLMVASFPLLAHLDAIKLDGDRLSVRRGFRWVGPVDLTDLVVLGYRPMAYRRPATWMLIQRDAGPKLRWPRTLDLDSETRQRLVGQDGLRLLEVAAGSAFSEVPGLSAHIARCAVGSGAVIDSRALGAIDAAARRRQGGQPAV